MNLDSIAHIGYLIATVCFILGIKKLSSPKSARFGNALSGLGMLVAIIVTIMQQTMIDFQIILIGLVIGTGFGVIAARFVAMTAMPEMVALLNGFGGGSSLLLALGAVFGQPNVALSTIVITVISLFIGSVTLSGSVIAWLKLAEKMTGKPIMVTTSRVINIVLMLIVFGITIDYGLTVLDLSIGWLIIIAC